MRLACMHEERMAQVHCARWSGGGYLVHAGGGLVRQSGDIQHRHAFFSRGSQEPRNSQMRSHSNSRGRVFLANIREQKQHEQGSTFGSQVDAPFQVRSGVGRLVRRKTGVEMPSGICRIIGVRESDDESTDARSWNPTAHANYFVECVMQSFGVGCLMKWFLREIAEAYYGTCPRVSIVWIETN